MTKQNYQNQGIGACKCINQIQEAWGDRCLYEVPDEAVGLKPYHLGNGKIEMREAVEHRSTSSWGYGMTHSFTFNKDGKRLLEIFWSIGD